MFFEKVDETVGKFFHVRKICPIGVEVLHLVSARVHIEQPPMLLDDRRKEKELSRIMLIRWEKKM